MEDIRVDGIHRLKDLAFSERCFSEIPVPRNERIAEDGFPVSIEAVLSQEAVGLCLTSLVSVYYYLRLVVLMYFREGDADLDHSVPLASMIALAVAAVLIVVLGLYPSLIVDLTRSFFKI